MKRRNQTPQERLRELEDELRRAVIAEEDTSLLRADIELLLIELAENGEEQDS